MNYYNPYVFYPYASMATPTNTGLLSGALSSKGFSFSTLLNGAQKTLNFVNQAIPVVKQVSPMMKNAKTMFKVMNEFKKVDTPVKKGGVNTPINNTVEKEKIIEEVSYNSDIGPTFFA